MAVETLEKSAKARRVVQEYGEVQNPSAPPLFRRWGRFFTWVAVVIFGLILARIFHQVGGWSAAVPVGVLYALVVMIVCGARSEVE